MENTESGKLDYKKDFKDLYLPPANPVLINVPAMQFLMVDGRGDPNGGEYPEAVSLLYGLSYTIKMKGKNLKGYTDYVVPPLEGLWWAKGENFDYHRRDNWLWTAMIRQYDFVTEDVLSWAAEIARKKNPDLDYGKARLETFSEGLCVQAMHTGPYADEPATLEKIHTFAREKGLRVMTGNERKHHEIYLSDPNKSIPEKMKTVLRIPVGK